MSRILRRPMFRGGPASSDGVGITSGLDNPRQRYADGPTDEGVQQDEYSPIVQDILGIKDWLKLKGATAVDTVFNVPVNKASEYITGYNPGLSAVRQMQQKGDPTFAKYDPDKAYFFNTPTEARKGTIKQNLEYKKEKEKQFEPSPPPSVTVTKGEKSLPSLYDEFSSIINKANLVDQDEFTKQKYLELSKFGLNLLRQPGGPAGGKPNLMGAIAAAAEKPLEGYSNILTRESQAKQVPKQLALQATLSAMAPGQYSKAIRDLVQSGVPPEKAREFILKEATSQQRAQDRLDLDYYGEKLSNRFDFLKNKENIKKGIPDSATQSFLNWKKTDPNLTQGQISELPKDKNLAIDKKYYIDPNTGVIVRFDKKINNYREAGEI
jgi:hypothetical protein